ncbi:PREDICTED: protein FAM8A1 [Chaetura pelagica]|uniref:protein FAM8A1 n=1 Tax=Chaetura pelagica TaxID=8897 RepID=UPI000523EBDD|nr:PREDICTED: protein FAM8A1 [Chaetura pelagica]
MRVASIFNSQTSYPQGFQPPELEDKDREQDNAPIIQEVVVNDLLLHLDTHKSDGIHPRVLRELAGELAKPSSIICQQSWSAGEVPDDWRLANVTPIYRKGWKKDVGNYRHVSLTLVPGKIMERLVLSELAWQVQGREFIIPSLAHRFIAEMVDFFILFFIKATIVLSIMHLSGIKDISKFAMHYIIEEIDEDTSMEDLQKMVVVALIYRLLVCFYEIICIWGAGGATPGKFLLGLRVVTCDTSVLIAPSRVLVIPSSNVSMTTSTIRALIKNFSIASFFPAFITLLFFQHNRTAYDIVAGTIVVRRNGVR